MAIPVSTYRVNPAVVQGEITVPPSKSITHRALILAALSHQPVRISNILQAEDTELTLEALRALGYEIKKEGTTVIFSGVQQPPAHTPVQLFVGNSGTTARLISAVAAVQSFPVVVDGNDRMRQRPMKPLFDALVQIGAQLEDHQGFLPVTIHGISNAKRRVTIDPRLSSQFVSALLLIAPLFPEGLQIQLSESPSSRSYIELTLGLLHQFGITTRWEESVIHVFPGQLRPPKEFAVEGDFSSASYFIIAAQLTGGKICIPNLTPQSLQGDREILAIVSRAGARVESSADGICIQGTGRIKPIQWDMHHCPDLVPGVAVMCLFAEGPSELKNISHLRFKESDRIDAICTNAERLGGNIHYKEGNLIIIPRSLHSGKIDTFNDHRIAMAFALAGLRVPGVEIENPQCVGKSYPQYWEHLEKVAKT